MSDVLAVRPITDADVDTVIALWRATGSLRPWNDPARDIALARDAADAEILVGFLDDRLAASVMVGFDGHRGWVYYVAVQPDLRGQGLGGTIMHHAEAWLRHRKCPKIELMIRPDNDPVRRFYQALDYRDEPRAVMTKWLIEPPAPQVEVLHGGDPADPPDTLDVTITWLEMAARPQKPPVPPPVLEQPLSLLRLEEPTVSYWRYLYDTVGEPWFWREKRAMDEDALAEIIRHELVEIYVLSVGNTPAGFIQLDRRSAPSAVDVDYFGLVPDYIGRGLGAYLLDWGIRVGWDREPRPQKLTVNTCTMDHPAALPTYQRAGFTPVRQETVSVPDPRRLGHLPADLELPPHFDAVAHPGPRR